VTDPRIPEPSNRRIYADRPGWHPITLDGAADYLASLSAPVLGRLAETLRLDLIKAERERKADLGAVAAGHAEALRVLVDCIEHEMLRRDDATEWAEATPLDGDE